MRRRDALRRKLAPVILLALLASLPQASVQAANANLELSRSLGPPTIWVGTHGTGFDAGETVDLSWDGTVLGRTIANSTGAFRKFIRIPGSALPGDHVIEAAGEQSGSSIKAVFSVHAEWGKPQNAPTNTGFNPFENILNPTNVAGLVERWTAPVGGYAAGPASVAAGVVYAVSDALYAWDEATGELLWKAPITDPITSPAVHDGIAFVGAHNRLLAIDAKTGATVWSRHPGGYLSESPTVVGSTVYYAGWNGTLGAVDTLTGAYIWSRRILTGSVPAVVDGTVYANDLGTGVYALDAKTGRVLWNKSPCPSCTGSLAVSNGLVYLCGENSVEALDPETGSTVWTTSIQGTCDSPSVAYGKVYAGIYDGPLVALDAADGTLLWTTTVVNLFVTPSIANGLVFERGWYNGEVYAFDAMTGDLLWTGAVGYGGVSSAPLSIVDGLVFVGGTDGAMHAFGLPPTLNRVSQTG